MKPRLLIITSHPIQYQAPWFRALHDDGRLDLQVMFLSLPDAHEQGAGFENEFEWDVPLLEGYSCHQAASATGSIREGWWGLRVRNAKADIAASSPDAVLVTGWQNLGMLQCFKAAHSLGLPLLLRAESNGLAPASFLRRQKNRWIIGKADRLLPIGKSNRRFYEALDMRERISFDVPYFVDNEFFAVRSQAHKVNRSELRARWDIPEHACCFLFVGKLVPKKRPTDLLAAIETLTDEQRRKTHLLMVGAGLMESELRAQVKAADLPVTFTGFLNQTEIPAAYAAADCLVLPSDYGETWGLVVNEAMACGLPAIVSDRVGCGSDLIVQGGTGFIFRYGDPWELAQFMSRLMQLGDEKRRAMGARACRQVIEGFSIQKAVENTVRATFEVVQHRQGIPRH